MAPMRSSNIHTNAQSMQTMVVSEEDCSQTSDAAKGTTVQICLNKSGQSLSPLPSPVKKVRFLISEKEQQGDDDDDDDLSSTILKIPSPYPRTRRTAGDRRWEPCQSPAIFPDLSSFHVTSSITDNESKASSNGRVQHNLDQKCDPAKTNLYQRRMHVVLASPKKPERRLSKEGNDLVEVRESSDKLIIPARRLSKEADEVVGMPTNLPFP